MQFARLEPKQIQQLKPWDDPKSVQTLGPETIVSLQLADYLSRPGDTGRMDALVSWLDKALLSERQPLNRASAATTEAPDLFGRPVLPCVVVVGPITLLGRDLPDVASGLRRIGDTGATFVDAADLDAADLIHNLNTVYDGLTYLATSLLPGRSDSADDGFVAAVAAPTVNTSAGPADEPAPPVGLDPFYTNPPFRLNETVFEALVERGNLPDHAFEKDD